MARRGGGTTPVEGGGGSWEQGFGRVLLEDALCCIKMVPLIELPLILAACFS